MLKVPISVVIPTYNAERFIKRAIKSVQKQTVQVSEIIVVDDGSTDKTVQIAHGMGVTILRSENNLGVSAARNQGILNSKNKWIAFLDADDFWVEKKIEYQWQAIKIFPDVGIVSCYKRILYQEDSLKQPVSKNSQNYREIKNCIKINRYLTYFPPDNEIITNLSGIHISNCLIKREIFSAIGLFDETLHYHEDRDMIYRIMSKYPWLLVRRKLSYYRRHSTNATNNSESFLDGLITLADKIGRSPDNYPLGAAEKYSQIAKSVFIEKGKKLLREFNENKA